MTTIKPKYQGICANRYSREPAEKVFAEVWQDYNEDRNEELLPRMLTEDSGLTPPRLPSESWEVANTVVQWLGSEVGQYFLAEAIAKLPYETRDMLYARVESIVED